MTLELYLNAQTGGTVGTKSSQTLEVSLWSLPASQIYFCFRKGYIYIYIYLVPTPFYYSPFTAEKNL
jgi:hypothetical protein